MNLEFLCFPHREDRLLKIETKFYGLLYLQNFMGGPVLLKKKKEKEKKFPKEDSPTLTSSMECHGCTSCCVSQVLPRIFSYLV